MLMKDTLLKGERKMNEKYVTIVGFKNYYDIRPFAIGTKLLCVKEPDNAYDSEAIKATFPVLGTVGYIANSVKTKANGTLSAGRIYEQVGAKFIVEVAFTTFTKVIARITDEDPSILPEPTVSDEEGYEADDTSISF